jgi:hypothetical protein
VDSFTLNAEQVLDNDVLTLYYGGGDASVTTVSRSLTRRLRSSVR